MRVSVNLGLSPNGVVVTLKRVGDSALYPNKKKNT